ncbi:MAG: hypothetical protein ACE5MB_06110 [Anaerolineae bacterium]
MAITDIEKRREPLVEPLPEIKPEIVDLERMVADLPQAEQERFQRIFHVSTTTGRLNPPETMHQWIKGYFGSVEAVLAQRIVKVTNVVTWEGALFNELRARRPMEARSTTDVTKTIMGKVNDPFCKPLERTPADVFGRVEGQYSITASNIAKYDGFHGLVIFDEHNPLIFTPQGVSDYIDTAWQWAQEAHRMDPQARYFFFMWNCLWKAAASILHGHTQMTLTKDMHYAKVESLRRAALAYRERYGSSYFDDLYRAHEALGLAFEEDGIRVMAYLTPVKEKETLLLSEGLNARVKEAIFRALRCFTGGLGVMSFNIAIYLPPIAPVEEDWGGFPTLVRLVDRGDPVNRTCDIGAMELYAASVIGTDPFFVAKLLREYFR